MWLIDVSSRQNRRTTVCFCRGEMRFGEGIETELVVLVVAIDGYHSVDRGDHR